MLLPPKENWQHLETSFGYHHRGCWASQVALVAKKLPANAGDIRDLGSISGLGKSLGGGNGNPLQYSYLENPMDRGTWWATVHGVTRVGHDLATTPPPPPMCSNLFFVRYLPMW